MMQAEGVHQLMVAEKHASDVVLEARKRKQIRLKQAKEEAESEIEKFRQEQERQFNEFQEMHLGSRGGATVKIEADIVKKNEEIKNAVNTKKDSVIQDIIELVCELEPKAHPNVLMKMKQ